tara:strand:+ start:1811 stop:2074 length:264 start_codon:yes stop_codon:yes gene_type:complete
MEETTATAPRQVENYLGVTQAAELLSVCSVTIRKMITEGTLAAYRLTPAGHWRIRVSEFNRVAHDLESGQATEPATASTSDLEQLLS